MEMLMKIGNNLQIKNSGPRRRSAKRARAKVRPLRTPTIGPNSWAPLFRSFAPAHNAPIPRVNAAAPSNLAPKKSPQFSLRNTDGFWELAFGDEHAVLRQHPALFFAACLLALPSSPSLSCAQLEAAVYDQFLYHEDFARMLPALWLQGERQQVLKLLRHQEQALNQIVDSPAQPAPVKNEALLELLRIYDLQAREPDAPRPSRPALDIYGSLLDLHNRLAVATDPLGQPQALICSFARHLLLHIIIPSIRASRGLPFPLFTYSGESFSSSSSSS
jgi:hypothetical protein